MPGAEAELDNDLQEHSSVLDLQSCFAIFEDSLSPTKQLVLFHKLEQCIEVRAPEQLNPAFALIEEARKLGHWVVLAAHYELGLALEPRLASRLPPANAEQHLLRAWVFSERTECTAETITDFWRAALNKLSPQEKDAGLLTLSANWAEKDHASAVNRILEYIKQGDCYQANLTMPMHGISYGHPLALYARLRDRQPVRYSTLINTGSDWILSLSPELFVEKQGTTLTCRPMKGTAKRGENGICDDTIAQELLASEKNRAENLMIVDLIRNDLGKLVAAGCVKTTALFDLERYSTVFQLTSTVEAAPCDASLENILRALYPCGSITGAPKIRSMEIISELEPLPRGLYCGALGWQAPDGNLRLSVPIRTLSITRDSNCRLDVGSGIVADSRPAEEYAECLLKSSFATQLLDDLKLIETMRWTPGTGIALLEYHLNRIKTAARELEFVFDEGKFLAGISQAALQSRKPLRIRVLLNRDGALEISAAELEPLPEHVTVCLATTTLNPGDPRLRYKTTARSFYDADLRTAVSAGYFDAIYCNTRGELCEGGRTNIFLEREGMLLTPPAYSGLLPGVLRQHLLESGRAEEAVLTLDNILSGSNKLWLGNAVRGLFRAVLDTDKLPSSKKFG